METNIKHYSMAEEMANGITHGIGLALSVAGLTLLVVLAAREALRRLARSEGNRHA